MHSFKSVSLCRFSAAAFGAVLLIWVPSLWAYGQINGRGADVPWIEYEAEDGTPAGGAVVVGPGRTLGTIEGEASGRRAVKLDNTGASVSWTAAADANSIVIRASIPDAPGGGGIEAPISLYVNGAHRADIVISSVHSWIYGDYGTQTDNPGAGPARKIYDESHLLFNGFSISAGDAVMLRRDDGDNAASYAIDFIDLEQVDAPIDKPEGFIDITDGSRGWQPAVADDGVDDINAIEQCIAAAQAGQYVGVYFPQGTFEQSRKIMTTNVAIQGAGMWYTRLYCPVTSEDAGWGQTGFNINGDNCSFRDFMIEGWGGTRTQGGKAWVNGSHKNAVIERMWVEHVQCGYWVGGFPESTNLLVRDCRFRNTGADGINLCNGNLGSIVENCTARNTGDDAFAIWSATDLYPHPCTDNVIRNCTASLPWRAACFAIYGGTNNRIENCVAADALTYPGLTVSSEFSPYPLESATVDGMEILRCGSTYWDATQEFGAVWLFSCEQTFQNVTIRNVNIVEPTYQAIHIQSSKGGNPGYPIGNTLFENISISNPTTFGVQIKAGSLGGATFRNIAFSDNQNGVQLIANQASGFSVTEETTPVMATYFSSAEGMSVRSCGSGALLSLVLDKEAQANVSLVSSNGKMVLSQQLHFPAGSHSVFLTPGSGDLASGWYAVSVQMQGKICAFPLVRP